jgi:hypothetical protein
MPLLSQHQSNDFTKMLLMGDPSSGKTGACASLVAADYHLRILDMDNGLDSLKQFVLRECPDKIQNVEFRTLRDKYKATAAGPIIAGGPKAFVEATKMLDRWKYDDIDLGVPAEWGPEAILVLDSLTMLSDAAYDWAEPMVPQGRKSGERDNRAIYGMAQDAIEKILALLTSEAFHANVLVIAHVKYIDNPDGGRKGYPTSVGQALSPVIPRYFNSVALCQTTTGGKRTIQTAATAMIDLKNPKPFEMLPKYDISTGLADFFKVLRASPTQPKLKRVL